MSELKEVKFHEMNAIKLGLRNDKLYFKSEADKVIAEKDKEIAELKEERRWRKYSEELPPKDGSYMCAYKNKNKEDGVLFVDEAVWDGEKWSYKFDFWEDIIYWQFKPKAPDNRPVGQRKQHGRIRKSQS